MTGDVWAEIDLSAIANNIGRLRSLLGPDTRMMSVVKANAYGHGMLPVSRQVLTSGSDFLGVARYEEAMQLRRAGIEAPILIFGYTPPAFTRELVANNLTQTIYSYQTAREMAAAARQLEGRLTVHLKVDTGMGRLGIVAGTVDGSSGSASVSPTAIDEIAAIKGLAGLAVEGVYTHFATADQADKRFAHLQLELFKGLTSALAERGIAFDICHAANSAATIDMPEAHMDMVRAGISIYGLYPSDAVSHERIVLIPAMTLKSRIIHLKDVDPGFPVSYGATAKTKRATTIATVSIGYADGYNRMLSSRGRMRVRGKFAPVIGRVCMDQTMLDVGHIPGVRVGDEVVVFGHSGTEELPVAEIADLLGTINYEVVSGIADRVGRVYRNPVS